MHNAQTVAQQHNFHKLCTLFKKVDKFEHSSCGTFGSTLWALGTVLVTLVGKYIVRFVQKGWCNCTTLANLAGGRVASNVDGKCDKHGM